VPASSAVVSRPRYLHANGSEACDETWLRAQTANERYRQGETARVARLEGDLQSIQLSSSGWEHKSHALCVCKRATCCSGIPRRRPRSQEKSMAQTECTRALLGKLWRGRHQPTDIWWRSSRLLLHIPNGPVHICDRLLCVPGLGGALKQCSTSTLPCTLPARHTDTYCRSPRYAGVGHTSLSQILTVALQHGFTVCPCNVALRKNRSVARSCKHRHDMIYPSRRVALRFILRHQYQTPAIYSTYTSLHRYLFSSERRNAYFTRHVRTELQ